MTAIRAPMLRTIFSGLILGLFVLLVGLPLLLVAWISGTIGPLYPATAIALRLELAVAGVRVRSVGKENIPAQACLFLANHTSAVDPIAVFISIPGRIAFMAKEELFRIPLFGLAMRRARFVSVDRADHNSAAVSAQRAVNELRKGISMVIYPEGTRSRDGRLLPFKRGAFLIAIRAKRPIVPVTVIGAGQVLARGQWRIRPGEIVVHFHPAIDVSDYSELDRESLRERVRAVIATALPPEHR